MSETIQIPTLLSNPEYQKMSAYEKETHIKEILRKTLKMNPSGVTVTQLNQKLPFDRRIIEKHLAAMEFTNEIYIIKLGSNKLYIPNHKALHEATRDSERIEHFEYNVYTLKNKLGDFVVVQQKDLRRDSADITGGLQIPLAHYEKFVNYLKKSLVDIKRRELR